MALACGARENKLVKAQRETSVTSRTFLVATRGLRMAGDGTDRQRVVSAESCVCSVWRSNLMKKWVVAPSGRSTLFAAAGDER